MDSAVALLYSLASTFATLGKILANPFKAKEHFEEWKNNVKTAVDNVVSSYTVGIEAVKQKSEELKNKKIADAQQTATTQVDYNGFIGSCPSGASTGKNETPIFRKKIDTEVKEFNQIAKSLEKKLSLDLIEIPPVVLGVIPVGTSRGIRESREIAAIARITQRLNGIASHLFPTFIPLFFRRISRICFGDIFFSLISCLNVIFIICIRHDEP